jgi:anti-sigma-K factor RskA
MTTPTPWPELLAGYVLGDLSPSEVALLEEYLATHPEAQSELEHLQTTLNLMPLALPASSPASELKQRLMQAAQPSAASSSQKRWVGGFGAVVTALAATAIAGLGWQNYRLTQELASSRQDWQRQQAMLMQPSNRLLAIKGLDASQPSVGSLILVPASSQAMLTLKQVPPLPPGKVYRMWAYLKDQEQEIACANFRPDRSGYVSQLLSLEKWQKVTTVIVTIETEQESPEALGEAVMMGSEEVEI